MEEEIRFIILKNLEEVNSRVDSLEGLCFYFAKNIQADLEMMEIPSCINKINGYDHYYLIADEYLIDPTYSQFLPKDEKLVSLQEYPTKVLEKTEKGKEILGDLLYNGYHKLEDDDINIYLSSFKVERKKTK